MANQFFPKGKKKILDADIDLLVDTIKVYLIKNTYTFDAADEFLADLGAVTLSTAQVLTSRSTTAGVFDAADSVFTAVTAGDTTNAVIIAKDTGSTATSPLIAYYDSITNFPFTTTGADVTIEWSNGAAKIFAI